MQIITYCLIEYLNDFQIFVSLYHQQLRRIAEFKRDYSDVLKDIMPEDEKQSFVEHDVVNVLTNLDQDGRRVLIVNCGRVWDPKKVSSDSLFRIFYLIHLAALVEECTQVRGVVVIMDFEGLGMSQVGALSPSWSKRLLTFIQDAMPLRLKQVHMINQPFVFKLVWALFKPFIQKKLSQRVSLIISTFLLSFVLIFSIFAIFRCSSTEMIENHFTN